MKTLDPKGEPLIQLMLDAYDTIASAHVAQRSSAFRQVCRRVIAAVATTGRVSHADCESWLSAIGMHARIPNAEMIVRGEISAPSRAQGTLH